MYSYTNRRRFIKLSAVTGLGFSIMPAEGLFQIGHPLHVNGHNDVASAGFTPKRMASWWSSLENLLWSQKKQRDLVKERAAGFAEARIDTAINFGFHVRFDFSNYFGQMNEYFAAVKQELHQYGIKFMEHYSCNHVERPRGKSEFDKLHRTQRHHVLLFHDSIAAGHAQYEGHLFNDICEIDLIDGTRGYARQYQMEAFCHNNPGFLDMHEKYLQRLEKEVGFDAYQVDDMCDYVGLRSCGCKHCRDRFKKDYGHTIPPPSEKTFWGDMNKPMLQWGNYDNPVFRDWIKMKDDSIADHVKMIKTTLGAKPLMTCCSSTGPITLNSISLNLERIAPLLDLFMLENVGVNIRSLNWIEKDAEALQQKDIAEKRGHVPSIALSYTVYEEGGYLGWALARFWGVANWSSTLHQRLEEDPPDAMKMEDVVGPVNRWEMRQSLLDFTSSKDITEVRLVYNYYNRINGWRDEQGKEQWDKIKSWSEQLVENNVGYRILRYQELADAAALSSEQTPLILDGLACISQAQFDAILKYLSGGGKAFLALPFGTHDENGNIRKEPLSKNLLGKKHANVLLIDSSTKTKSLEQLIVSGKFTPLIKQTGGDKGWAIRLRTYQGKPVIHFLNRKMIAVPHETIKDMSGVPVLKSIRSGISNNQLTIEIDAKRFKLGEPGLFSPELKDERRQIRIDRKGNIQKINVDLKDIRVYAVAQ